MNLRKVVGKSLSKLSSSPKSLSLLFSSSSHDQNPPTALVTGSTDGIGLTTAKHLAAKGYNVIIHGRDDVRLQRAREIIESFVKYENGELGPIEIFPLRADLSTVHETEKLATNVRNLCSKNNLRLSVLMNNAGVYEEKIQYTSDGIEMTFAVNVLAPFVLTSHLLPTLLPRHGLPKGQSGQQQEGRNTRGGNSRIVIASSISQCGSIRYWDDDLYAYRRRSYSAHGAYSESKLLDAMLCIEMDRRLRGRGTSWVPDRITCNCLDPGTVNTKMLLAGWGPIGIDVEDALDETFLCTSSEVESTSGQYFTWKTPRSASRSAYDDTERAKMWSILSDLAPDAAKMWNFEWDLVNNNNNNNK